MRKSSRMVIAAQLADHADLMTELTRRGIPREQASETAYAEIRNRRYSFTLGRVIWKKRADCDGKPITIIGGYAKGAFEG